MGSVFRAIVMRPVVSKQRHHIPKAVLAVAASGIIFFSVSNISCRDHGGAPLLSLQYSISLPLSPLCGRRADNSQITFFINRASNVQGIRRCSM